MYDSMIHPNQPPLFRELLQSLPHGYNLGGSRNRSSLFSNGGDKVEHGSKQLFENGVLEFSKEVKPFGRGRGGNKGIKCTERERRVRVSEQYKALQALVPNPTKSDRASIVGDVVDYILELKRTVSELKHLVEKKRRGIERSKRQMT